VTVESSKLNVGLFLGDDDGRKMRVADLIEFEDSLRAGLTRGVTASTYWIMTWDA